jgi:adenylyltransferase/sulfurtransferase
LSVLVVGMGGLGCPASLALAQAGVERLTLIDPDCVDATNLHRQLWQRTDDVGRPKVAVASERLKKAFPRVEVEARQERVTAENSAGLFAGHGLVVDGTDDWRAKLELSDTALRTGVPLVYGGVLRLQGQAMVVTREGACLRCLFEAPDFLPTCAQAGVLGTLAGVVGSLQALLGLDAFERQAEGESELWLVDGEELTQRRIRVRRAEDCRHG